MAGTAPVRRPGMRQRLARRLSAIVTGKACPRRRLEAPADMARRAIDDTMTSGQRKSGGQMVECRANLCAGWINAGDRKHPSHDHAQNDSAQTTPQRRQIIAVPVQPRFPNPKCADNAQADLPAPGPTGRRRREPPLLNSLRSDETFRVPGHAGSSQPPDGLTSPSSPSVRFPSAQRTTLSPSEVIRMRIRQ